MKELVVFLLIVLSVQAVLPSGTASKPATDGRLTIFSGALGGLAIVSSASNLADALWPWIRPRRRRRSSRRRRAT